MSLFFSPMPLSSPAATCGASKVIEAKQLMATTSSTPTPTSTAAASTSAVISVSMDLSVPQATDSMDLSTPQRFKRSREKSSPNDIIKIAKIGVFFFY